MKTIKSKRLLQYVLVTLFIFAITIPAVGGISQESTQDGEKIPPIEPRNGFDNETFHALWSHDKPGDYKNVDIGENQTALQLRNQTEITFSVPIEQVSQWNDQELDRFDKALDRAGSLRNTTVAPASAPLSDESRFLDKAYSSIYALQPSTRVHFNDTSRPLYIAEEGSLLATTDYQIDVPHNISKKEKRVFWSVENENISATASAITNFNKEPIPIGRSVDTDRTLDFSYDTPVNTERIILDVNITVKINKTIQKRKCENESCSEWTTTTQIIPDTQIVGDGRPVHVHTLDENVDGLIVDYSEYILYEGVSIRLKTNESWSAIGFQNRDRLVNRWSFYSGRKTSWDKLKIKRDSSKAVLINSTTLPLQIHAYPSGQNPITLGPAGEYEYKQGGVMAFDGPERNAPQKPAYVDVPVADDEYQLTHKIEFRHQTAYENKSKIAIYGLVYGVSKNISTDWIEVFEPKKSFIETETIHQNDTHHKIKIILFNENDEPITTRQTDGFVQVGNKTVQTNESGIATAVVPRHAGIRVAYYPEINRGGFFSFLPGGVEDSFEDWLSLDEVYLKNETFISAPSSSPPFPKLAIGLLFMICWLWFPLWWYDKTIGTKIWPPWKNVF